MDIIRKRKIS